ncbi:hypothetical protein CGRA01v4_07989 [Colletotrichum graminicola]|uniref:Uncharacterized protein n=1 Tax=Colletotrichum graminicola (strain M1.001 / M2 / FGSC 10212) TaxID=645133 RepID=E3Q7X9_COLGM|nr:uncharacterized protein GLRG_02162 [Colletotrichum graminicola M1.001]EFQ26991.1 hypothetical protein GLRG_02162 [Colletotrichum graminicola M1.001]WDK16706.1 hypothetical protein CGRA01v4_07989 [Colletotrichum graminicola]
MPRQSVPHAWYGPDPVIPRRTHKTTSLYHSAPRIVSAVVILSITASVLLTAIYSMMRPNDSNQSVIVCLAILVGIAQNSMLLGFVLHNCIGLPPISIGVTVFAYFILWIVLQTFGFTGIDIVRLHTWPRLVRNVCAIWMVLTILNIWLFLIALFVVIAERQRIRTVTRFNAARRTEARLAMAVTRDALDVEAASSVQPPPYVPVRETKNQHV